MKLFFKLSGIWSKRGTYIDDINGDLWINLPFHSEGKIADGLDERNALMNHDFTHKRAHIDRLVKTVDSIVFERCTKSIDEIFFISYSFGAVITAHYLPLLEDKFRKNNIKVTFFAVSAPKLIPKFDYIKVVNLYSAIDEFYTNIRDSFLKNTFLFQHFLKGSVQHIYNESFDDPNNNNKKLLKVYTIDDNILGKYDVELYDMFTNDDTNETYVHVPPFSKRAALTEAQAPDWGHLSHLMFYELPGYDKAFWERLLDHANIHEQRLERRDNDPSTVYGYKIKGCLNPAVDEKLFRSTFK